MKQSAATVIPFPQPSASTVDADPEMAQVRAFLQAKRMEREAKAMIESLKKPVLATVRARGGVVAVSGLGSLTVVEKSAATLVDMDAVEAILERYGEPLPVKEGKGGGSELRATLVK